MLCKLGALLGVGRMTCASIAALYDQFLVHDYKLRSGWGFV